MSSFLVLCLLCYRLVSGRSSPGMSESDRDCSCCRLQFYIYIFVNSWTRLKHGNNNPYEHSRYVLSLCRTCVFCLLFGYVRFLRLLGYYCDGYKSCKWVINILFSQTDLICLWFTVEGNRSHTFFVFYTLALRS